MDDAAVERQAHGKGPEDGHQPSDVILVWVRENHDID